MRRDERAGILAQVLFFLALAILSAACDSYDERLIEWETNFAQSGGGGGGGAGASGTGGSGNPDAATPDTGAPDGGARDAATVDGEQPPEPGCVPGSDELCPWVCPEKCDGADNDCDGDTDERGEGELCDLSNALSTCVKGACVIDECSALFGNCDSIAENGCETALDTLTDCGECDLACPGTDCTGGVCDATAGCDPGWANCNQSTSDGCETELGTDTDCSRCDDDCGALDHVQAASCESGSCLIAGCSSDWADCDTDYTNGCEVDLTLASCTPEIDIFVDKAATGANNGTSWQDAYSSLAAAISSAGSGKKIGVKAGTYTQIAYPLKSGVQIYGGFSPSLTGTYGMIAKRNLAVDLTVIDGAKAGRCLTAAANGYLDGFTLQNCRAAGSNAAAEGGAIYVDAADVTFASCVFKNNEATSFGGAIRVAGGGTGLRVVDSSFQGNEGSFGGAVYSALPVAIENSTFDTNTATANHGGALRILVGGSTCARCVFTGNNSIVEGGAVYVTNGMTFTDSRFIGNSSGAAVGGAIRAFGTGLVCTNCLFATNTASGGGAVFADQGGDTYSNCTFKGNVATNYGGIWGAATTTVLNSILWDNAGGNQVFPATAVVNYSDVEGGWGSGVGNLNADPLFVTGPGGDYYLSEDAIGGQASDSPCIDKGNQTAAAAGLDTRTTRTDGVADSAAVDLGYHY